MPVSVLNADDEDERTVAALADDRVGSEEEAPLVTDQ